ncbi:cupin domain-containing protein [Tropicibacter sp. Alg240-R139]|uniref:cupin domain-containing protein n=1 Tax=Tropicibacter sp. Alg240-R139 TaxID=2305991 RepID=UPI0013E06B35|nr:cupin domain-containing protein [Tropicibacter sp. Alg240-R139]
MLSEITKFFGAFAFGAAIGLSGSAWAQEDSVRRVVTGLDPSGKAVVLLDSEFSKPVAQQEPVVRNFWSLDEFPAVAATTDRGLEKITAAFGPGPQKLVFRTVDFPPAPPQEVLDTLPKDLFMKIAGGEAPKNGKPPVHPFTHRTQTIDFAVVLNGQIDMVLDDSTVHLKAGDVVVQQETNHAWVNNSSEVVRIVFVQAESKEQ